MIYHGDCLAIMPTLAAESVDAIVTDPPYGLGFMGKDWDHGVPGKPFWEAAHRVAKPGAHLLAFGGTRTYHRLASAIEDAGWEIRDCLVWAYASGFPKSLDVCKAIDASIQYGKSNSSGLRKVNDSQAVGLKVGSANRQDDMMRRRGIAEGDKTEMTLNRHGQRPLTSPVTPEAAAWQGWGTALKPAWEPIVLARKPLQGTVAANVREHGTGALNIDGTRIRYVNEQPPDLEHWKSTTGGWKNTSTAGVVPNDNSTGRWPANVVLGDPIFDGGIEGVVGGGAQATHAGTYSRFFLIPKASRADREPAGHRGDRINTHPTVKPTALMRHLVCLVTPSGGTVLDPFLGSGTTAKACELEGFPWVGIEIDAESIAIAEARLVGLQPSLGVAS